MHDFQLRHQGLQRLGALPHQALQLRESRKYAGFLGLDQLQRLWQDDGAEVDVEILSVKHKSFARCVILFNNKARTLKTGSLLLLFYAFETNP